MRIASHLPDEIAAAGATLKASYRAAAPLRGMRSRYVFFYLLIFGIGVAGALGLAHVGALSPKSSDTWRIGITVLSVLTGFMITTMLFTGKTEVAKLLTLEQLRSFTDKSNHLLVSQFATLLIHIAGLVCIGLLTVLASSAPAVSETLIPVAGGFFALSFFRSVLIPVQIIELHRFVHAAMLADKRAEVNNVADI